MDVEPSALEVLLRDRRVDAAWSALGKKSSISVKP